VGLKESVRIPPVERLVTVTIWVSLLRKYLFLSDTKYLRQFLCAKFLLEQLQLLRRGEFDDWMRT
jgi:hypothetical protein